MKKRIVGALISLLLLSFLGGATSVTSVKEASPAVSPTDTLSVQAFKSMFRYQGKGVVPDSLEWINCDFLLTFSEDLWNTPPFDWERYRLSVEGEIISLPFQGIPYSLTERKGGGYLATFLFVEAETSNLMTTRVLDSDFRVIESECEAESCGVLAYCGGDAGYEWFRDGQFVNDSLYVFRSIFYDEKYDTTWGSFVWDTEGKVRYQLEEDGSLIMGKR